MSDDKSDNSGGVSEGDTPFMFISPSDTNFLILCFCMGYFDKWYSWLLTPLSSALNKIGTGVSQGISGYINDAKARQEKDPSSYFTGFEDIEQRLIDAGYGDRVGANYWSKLQYNQTGMQSILGDLGFRTGADAFWENARMQYGEYLSGLESERFQNEYNSDLQKSSRMRQAGQNPDLLGTGDSANAVAPAEDTNNVLPPENDAMTQLSTFAGVLGDCFEFAMQTVGFTQEFQSNRNNILMQRTQLESSYQDFANKFILNNTPSEFPAEDWADKPYVHPDFGEGVVGDFFGSPEQYIASQIKDAFRAYQKQYGSMFTKKQWRHIDQMISKQVNSLPTTSEQWSGWRSQLTDKVDYAMNNSSRYYENEFDELRRALKPLIDLNDEIRSMMLKRGLSEQKSGLAQADYSIDYYNALSGTAMAGFTQGIQSSELQGLGLDNYMKSLNNKVENARKSVVTTLSDMADNGNVFAKAMLFRYSIVSSIISPAVNIVGSLGKVVK